MLRYFDKTFFHFLLGFIGMIALSMVVLVVIGYYETEMQQEEMTSAAHFSLIDSSD